MNYEQDNYNYEPVPFGRSLEALAWERTHQEQALFEIQYQKRIERIEELVASGKVIRREVEQPGFETLVGYQIGDNPDIVITMGVHGDEKSPVLATLDQIINRLDAGDPSFTNILLIPKVHAEAWDQHTRGLDLNLELAERLLQAGRISEEKYQQLLDDRNQLDAVLFRGLLEQLGYYVSENGTLSIDLNRQFIETEDGVEPEASTLYPKATQLITMIKTYAPNAVHGFGFHADNVTTGAYIYDTPKLFPDESPYIQFETFIAECISTFQNALNAEDLPLLNGIDDSEDTILGMNQFTDGYCVVPALTADKRGKRRLRTREYHDQTYETAMPRWLKRIQRYWCIETAGRLSPYKCKQIVDAFFEYVLLPIVRQLHN